MNRTKFLSGAEAKSRLVKFRKTDVKQVNFTGKRFGCLTALGFDAVRKRSPNRRWICRCDCGNYRSIVNSRLSRHKNDTRCVCVEPASKTIPDNLRKEHKIWAAMKSRCNCPTGKGFVFYGGRGIKVCPSWNKSFFAFIKDMGPRPSSRHTVERRDNDKGYSPDNCYWGTMKEQNRNKRNNRFITAFGERKLLMDFAESYKIPYKILLWRIDKGWKPEKALSTPVKKKVVYGNGWLSEFTGRNIKISTQSR